MKRYFVKSRFKGYCEVSKEQFDNFVKLLRDSATNIASDKRDDYIKTRTKLIEG